MKINIIIFITVVLFFLGEHIVNSYQYDCSDSMCQSASDCLSPNFCGCDDTGGNCKWWNESCSCNECKKTDCFKKCYYENQNSIKCQENCCPGILNINNTITN